MKRILALIFSFATIFFAAENANAQCVTDTTGCTGQFGALCPSTLPAATLGNHYDEDVTFFMPSIIPLADLGAPVDIEINQVVMTMDNVPDGLTVTYSNSNATYDPTVNPYGCFNISGAPCAGGGTYTIDVLMTATANIIIQTVDVGIPFQLELTVNSSYPSFDLTATSGFFCAGNPQPIGLEVPAGFDSYNWSTNETDDSIAETTQGTYSVTVTAQGDSVCTFTDEVYLDTVGAFVNANTTICNGEYFQLEGYGGDTYSWTPAANLTDSTAANPVVTDLSETTVFQLTVSNGQCSDVATVTVTTDSTCGNTCAGCEISVDSCQVNPFGTFCDNTITDIEAGVPFEGSITFSVPQFVDFGAVIQSFIGVPPGGLPLPDTLEVVWYEVFDVTDLPSGLDWECSQPGTDCRYTPGMLPGVTGTGCLSVCGTTCDQPGDYPTAAVLKIKFATVPELIATIAPLLLTDQYDASDSTFLIPVPLDPTVFYQNELTATPAGPIVLQPGESVTLTASAGLTDYEWSTGDTSTSIVVDAAGSYTIEAFDGNCTQDFTVEVSVNTGINTLNALANSFALYPNPNNGLFDVRFELTSRQNVTMEVYNLNGKLILQNNLGSVDGQVTETVTMGSYAKGVYFVRLTTEEGTVNKKVSIF